MLDVTDTIAAIASAPGGAARGIVRLSGPRVVECVAQLFTPSFPNVHRAARLQGTLQLDAPLGEVPCDLYLWPRTRSYTQQPSAELHLAGAPPIVQAALAHVCRHGARLASPGEFTLRAFLAGRLDLTQAEAVLGVIDANSQRELDVALKQLAGGLTGPLHALRERLLDLLAHLEAGLDFVEEDIEFISTSELREQLRGIVSELDRVHGQMRERDATSEAFRVVLTGAPNVGKSSLLNALVGHDAAIVSAIAGTTRDYVTRETIIHGLRCLVTDTAGLAGARNTPDAQAEERALQLVKDAHLVLLCRPSMPPASEWPAHAEFASQRWLLVFTKCDLLERIQPTIPPVYSFVFTSAYTGRGIVQLKSTIAERLRQLTESGDVIANTSARCRDSLWGAKEAAIRALAVVSAQAGEELIAAELRVALEELGHVVGAVVTDDVLDRIFSRFCIGK
jgi:tRNA modification GTPase